MLCCTKDNFFVTNVLKDLLSIYEFLKYIYCLHDHQPCARIAIAPLAFMNMHGRDKKYPNRNGIYFCIMSHLSGLYFGKNLFVKVTSPLQWCYRKL